MYGRPPFAVVTRFGFDTEGEYLKLSFEAEMEISDELYDGVITTARQDPLIKSTINVVASEHAPVDELVSDSDSSEQVEIESSKKTTKKVKPVESPKKTPKVILDLNESELSTEIDELMKE
jgi:hypothetical protein